LPGTLPFTVDSTFVAAGYFGDVTSLKVTFDKTGTACGGRGVAGAQGSCYKVSYTAPAMPSPLTGVQWQADVQPMGGGTYYNNFGVAPGAIPPAGATQATFWARGAVGGEIVTFGTGYGATAPCRDSITQSMSVTLTTAWTQYSIPFQGQTYTGGQVSAFSFTLIGAGATTAVTFYVDDILWAP
jgi:hypothetical protein